MTVVSKRCDPPRCGRPSGHSGRHFPRTFNRETRATCHPSRRARSNGLCSACYAVDYQNRRPDRVYAARDGYAARNVERREARKLAEYGLTPLDYAIMLQYQDGLCAICGRAETTLSVRADGSVKALAVDHDHTSDVVRGLLCSTCNAGLGQFADDPATLMRAALYLLRVRAMAAANPEARVMVHAR